MHEISKLNCHMHWFLKKTALRAALIEEIIFEKPKMN